MPNSWKIPVSPSQRFIVFGLLAPKAAEIADAAQGRIFRRTWKALGLNAIDNASIKNKGSISTEKASSREPALHDITIDMADYLFDKVVNRPRFPGDVLQLGDLFDAIDSIRDQKDSWAGVDIDGIADFDPSKDEWDPPKADARGQLISAMAVMAACPVENRTAIWKQLSQGVGGPEALCLAAETLVDEIRTAVVTAAG